MTCVLRFGYRTFPLTYRLVHRKLWGTKVDNAGSASDTGTADSNARIQQQPNTSPSERKGTPPCGYGPALPGSPPAVSIDNHSEKECGGHVPHMICMLEPPQQRGARGNEEKRNERKKKFLRGRKTKPRT